MTGAEVTGSASTVQEWGQVREVHHQQGAQWTQAYLEIGGRQSGNMHQNLWGGLRIHFEEDLKVILMQSKL